MLRYRMPLAEIATDFHDRVKTLSSGYASIDYEDDGHQDADIVGLNVKVNGQIVDALGRLVRRRKAVGLGRDMISTLKKEMKRQVYEVIIQAVVDNKVVAREPSRARLRMPSAPAHAERACTCRARLHMPSAPAHAARACACRARLRMPRTADGTPSGLCRPCFCPPDHPTRTAIGVRASQPASERGVLSPNHTARIALSQARRSRRRARTCLPSAMVATSRGRRSCSRNRRRARSVPRSRSATRASPSRRRRS